MCVCVCAYVCVCVCTPVAHVCRLNVHNHHSEDVEFVTYTNDGLVC